MRHKFEQNPDIDPADPLVVVQAAAEGPETAAISAYLDNYQTSRTGIISVKTPDRLVMVKTATIILADVQHETLLLYTTTGTITTHETLRHLVQRLGDSNFIQVSKHGVLNLDHLQSLEDSFSGNMTAVLTTNLKTAVSRKYVKELMSQLGL
ncbi:LytTr family transcriptional regulator [Levilactobacillus koreensis JCM 16448]|uniref:Transcriptional regulator n=1 Tax=Levilactobacillus koreensis TaxID=637971 RepID=A0AAC9ERK9_9LACO|nr:response regulator transcription factor [Levilactobacillus koreensis]AKP65757.1 transcriptional regulator [Levilactobacillus koreensis]KRK85860.1 LytTr family transcriptional regulator [Levilactobacillus koreensis JCM 16448]